MKFEIIISEKINHGDTVEINGRQNTIAKHDIKNDPLMGITIRGERSGNGSVSGKMFKRILFPKWFKGEIVGYFPQV